MDGDSRVLVERLSPGGPAAACKAISGGDELISVDKMDVSTKSLEQVHSMIGGIEGTSVHLCLCHAVGTSRAQYTVTVIRRAVEEVHPSHEGHIGMTLYRKGDDDSSPLLVESLSPGGSAASLGLIAVDDELLSVNGEDVHFKPFSTVHDLIGGVEGTSVTLSLRRGGQYYTAQIVRKLSSSNPVSSPAITI